MTLTWTSGYNFLEAVPVIEWGRKGDPQHRSPAGTLTFDRNTMCGMLLFIDNIYRKTFYKFWNVKWIFFPITYFKIHHVCVLII